MAMAQAFTSGMNRNLGVHSCGSRSIRPVRPTIVARQQHQRQWIKLQAAATDSRVKSASEQADDSDLKHLSPDILSMFHETQKNMLELNKSRLKALEELKEARKTINELEKKVQAYEKELVTLRENASTAIQIPAAPVAAVPAHASYAPNSFQVAVAPRAVEMTPPPPAAAPAPPPAPVNTVTIKYYSGWDDAFLHYNMDGRGWTQVPGERLQSGADGGKTITVAGKRLEFVLTNGKNDWDSPMGAGNYMVDGFGTYKLKSGKIEKLA